VTDAPAAGSDRRLIALAALLAVVVFVIDLELPVGASVSILYVIVVLLGLWAMAGRFAILAALQTSILAVADLPLSPEGGSVWGYLNRLLTLVAIWTTAALVVRYRHAAEALQEKTRRAREYEDVAGEAEDALRRSLKDLADIKFALDQSAIVATTDTKGTIKYVNDKFCEISKYSREELLGQDHRIINSGYHPKEFIRNLWVTIANGRIWHGEIRNRAKDGSIYWVDTTIVPFLDERGRSYQYMAIRYDITDRKQSEERLREQGALARLGEMAAVVAHEVKNPLAGIRGALQVIGARMPAGSRDRAIVGDIVARVDSLNEIVQDLLQFARPRPPRRAPLAIGELIRSTAALLKEDPAFHQVDVAIDGENPTIAADAEQLRLVFMNLLLNAAQAGGERSHVRVAVRRTNGRCEVQVSDNGPGIPPDVLEKIFEPFFTTKHRGTGLGLPVARRIVEMHDGEIDIESPPGGGTTVRVRLPVT
jgi:PAS domain S-box-containing protein